MPKSRKITKHTLGPIVSAETSMNGVIRIYTETLGTRMLWPRVHGVVATAFSVVDKLTWPGLCAIYRQDSLNLQSSVFAMTI